MLNHKHNKIVTETCEKLKGDLVKVVVIGRSYGDIYNAYVDYKIVTELGINEKSGEVVRVGLNQIVLGTSGYAKKIKKNTKLLIVFRRRMSRGEREFFDIVIDMTKLKDCVEYLVFLCSQYNVRTSYNEMERIYIFEQRDMDKIISQIIKMDNRTLYFKDWEILRLERGL